MQIITLLFTFILSSLFFFFVINIKWFTKTFRDITKDESGYTKLIQISLIILLSSLFVIIIIYYLFNPIQVDRIDIILTVIVGWLGAIIGNFFGEKSMKNLEDKRKINIEKLLNEINNKDLMLERTEPILKKI